MIVIRLDAIIGNVKLTSHRVERYGELILFRGCLAAVSRNGDIISHPFTYIPPNMIRGHKYLNVSLVRHILWDSGEK